MLGAEQPLDLSVVDVVLDIPDVGLDDSHEVLLVIFEVEGDPLQGSQVHFPVVLDSADLDRVRRAVLLEALRRADRPEGAFPLLDLLFDLDLFLALFKLGGLRNDVQGAAERLQLFHL